MRDICSDIFRSTHLKTNVDPENHRFVEEKHLSWIHGVILRVHVSKLGSLLFVVHVVI